MICFTPDSAAALVEALRGHSGTWSIAGPSGGTGLSVKQPMREDDTSPPFGEYGIHKAAIAELWPPRHDPVAVTTVLQPGHISGPGWPPIGPLGNLDPDVWYAVSAGQEIAVPGLGAELMHHVHADDVAQAFQLAIEQRDAAAGESFNVVAPSALTARGFLAIAAGWFGQTARTRSVGWAEFGSGTTANSPTPAGSTSRAASTPRSRRARTLLGYAPAFEPEAAGAGGHPLADRPRSAQGRQPPDRLEADPAQAAGTGHPPARGQAETPRSFRPGRSRPHPADTFYLAVGELPPRWAPCVRGSPRYVVRVRRPLRPPPGRLPHSRSPACNRSRGQSRRDADEDITQRGEVVDSCARPGRPNERLACVDSRSRRDRTRPRRAGVRRLLGQVDRGRYRCCRMVRPGDSSEEEPDHLVTHNFVDDAVVSNDRVGGQSIEAVEERVESAGRISFAHGCRATDIGKQQTDGDLHSSHLTLAEVRLCICCTVLGLPADCRYPARPKRKPPSPRTELRTACSVEGRGFVGTRRWLTSPGLSREYGADFFVRIQFSAAI